ncbi:hypothetical protein B488_04560 [Liberibacter crescens BT-1]|uniref:Uncharacterized protein n=1 Tax=Liberibacter crescens (strain BT-1) TaxID=1215343 RepID=L0EUW1_LIBCB|nr:hypothetical protein B488_04560 [Liberibacter crescens BT-1]
MNYWKLVFIKNWKNRIFEFSFFNRIRDKEKDHTQVDFFFGIASKGD